jgi:hypothetical protein
VRGQRAPIVVTVAASDPILLAVAPVEFALTLDVDLTPRSTLHLDSGGPSAGTIKLRYECSIDAVISIVAMWTKLI